MTTLDEEIAASRRRPGFAERISQRVKEDRPILDRLREHPTPSPERRAVDWPAADDGLPPEAWLG